VSRLALAALAALVLAACGARTELEDRLSRPRCGDGNVDPGEACDDGDEDSVICTDDCRLETCGNAQLDPGEVCDLGERNEDRPALAVIQGDIFRELVPRWIDTSAEVFYAYSSKSAHTGYEAIGTSRIFFTLGLDGELSLTTLHGIDVDATGAAQPEGVVDQLFSGLPMGSRLVVADDGTKEFDLEGNLEARGRWWFERNTDGGIIGSLAFPGNWKITVDSSFERGIDRWQVLGDMHDFAADPVDLDERTPADLVAFPTPSECRRDCTQPFCGDGRLDGGELCDDGNTLSNDGCRGDCGARD
jgi:cysteine-rich repeat protein